MSLLTLRSRYADRQSMAGGSRDSGLGRDELLSLLDAGLQMTFVAEAESAFRNSFGLDEFRLARWQGADRGRFDRRVGNDGGYDLAATGKGEKGGQEDSPLLHRGSSLKAMFSLSAG
jgi:hypothetical protein